MHIDGGADRWQRVKDKSLEAIERQAHEREAWLERLKAEDPDLSREVASLLAAHAQSDAVLDGVAADYVAPGSFAEPEERWYIRPRDRTARRARGAPACARGR